MSPLNNIYFISSKLHIFLSDWSAKTEGIILKKIADNRHLYLFRYLRGNALMF